jgi:hypothetical protein
MLLSSAHEFIDISMRVHELGPRAIGISALLIELACVSYNSARIALKCMPEKMSDDLDDAWSKRGPALVEAMVFGGQYLETKLEDSEDSASNSTSARRD